MLPPGFTTRRISATPFAEIGHEEDHQRHHRGIEGRVRIGQALCVADPELGRRVGGQAGAGEGELFGRGIDALHRGR